MTVFAVEVAVAQHRPPKVDAHIWYSIEATGGTDAELTALQWAAMDPCTVMPISAVVLDWEDGGGMSEKKGSGAQPAMRHNAIPDTSESCTTRASVRAVTAPGLSPGRRGTLCVPQRSTCGHIQDSAGSR